MVKMTEFNPKEAIKNITSKPMELKNFLIQKSPDRKLLLYFSLGYLSDMYLDHAEQMMKQGKRMESNHFTGKATQIREITRHIFGQTPDKDFYTDQYEVPESWSPELREEEIAELAQFCVSNLPETPQVRDPNQLEDIIREKLSEYGKRGINRRFVIQIEKALERWNSPHKLMTLLELTFLLDNINQVLEEIKEETQAEEEESEEEIYPGVRKGEDLDEFK